MNPDEIEKALQNFFESIDFLPQGEKIAELKKAINIASKSDFDWESEGESKFDFLRKLKPREIGHVIKVLEKQKKDEIKKVEQMRAVFKAFHSTISDKEIMRISYPDGIVSHAVPSKRNKTLCFSSKQMKKWYEENGKEEMYPFRYMTERIRETDLLRVYSFGIVNYVIANGILYLTCVQPLTFFRGMTSLSRREGKGISQPLNKAHLLMLFLLLKEADRKKAEVVKLKVVDMYYPTQKKNYREIIKIAPEHTDEYWAIFKKS